MFTHAFGMNEVAGERNTPPASGGRSQSRTMGKKQLMNFAFYAGDAAMHSKRVAC